MSTKDVPHAHKHHTQIDLLPLLLGMAAESVVAMVGERIGASPAHFVCLSAAICYVIYKRYFDILSASGEPDYEPYRQKYLALRASLAQGGKPQIVYAQWLRNGLKGMEVFLGDHDLTGPNIFTTLFGMKSRAPLWTAPALGRCFIFAFVYPIAAIFAIWVIRDSSGTAEKVLGLAEHPHTLGERLAAATGMAVALSSYFGAQRVLAGKHAARHNLHSAGRVSPRQSKPVLLGFYLFATLAGTGIVDWVLGSSLGAVDGTIIVVGAAGAVVNGDLLVGLLGAICAALVGSNFVALGYSYAIMAAAVAGVSVGLAMTVIDRDDNRLTRLRIRLRSSYVFWFCFLAASLAICILLARLLSHMPAWKMAGPIILFFGWLSVLNAPFLWFSLGLTRGLLWLGLEREKWWPYIFALIDVIVGLAVATLMVVLLVVGIQTLDLFVPKDQWVLPLLKGDSIIVKPLLEFEPSATQFWWVYSLLLSAMLPSLFNLGVSILSLARGSPWVSRYIHAQLPRSRQLEEDDSNRIAFLLLAQMAAGAGLVFLAGFSIWEILTHLPQDFAQKALDHVRAVARFNLPAFLKTAALAK